MDTLRDLIGYFLKKKWLGLLLVAVLVIGTGVSTFYRGAISPKQRTDLTVYLKAAEMIAIGRADHIYGIETERHWHYVYSPLLAILLVPLVKLPLGANVLLAYLISIGAIAGTFYLSRACSSKPNAAGWQIALAAFLCLPLFLNTLSRAQFGILMLFFSILIFYCYLKYWKFLAGFLLAFAVTLKISPLAVAILFFLFKKEWRVLGGALCGIVFFGLLLPSVIIGPEINWTLLKTWHSLMAAGSSDKAHTIYLWSELFTPFANDNQSLYAVVTRLAWPSEAQFVTGSNVLIRTITSAIGIFLLGILFFKKLPPKTENAQNPVGLFAEYSLYPMLMLFASPVTQIHHYTNLYLLFLAALFLMEQLSKSSWKYRVLLVGFWVCASGVFLGYILEPLSAWGAPLWGSMLLWGAVLTSIKNQKQLC